MARKYDINIEGQIGDWITGDSVRKAMRPYGDNEIKVRISSLGGSLSDGLDICTLFRGHGKVKVYLSGFVASAATILAMGAHRIVMAPEAVMLVHNSSILLYNWERVNKEDITKKKEELENIRKTLSTFDDLIANIYSARTGKSVEEMAALMKEERWITAQEALEIGLIDEIDKYDESATGQEGITATVTAMCSEYGLPVPPLPIVSEPSMIERALAKLGFGKKNDDVQNKKHCLIMDKTTHPNLLNALGVEQITASEKGVMISTAQAEKLNNALATANTEVDDAKKHAEELKKQNTELQAKIDKLQEEIKAAAGADGDETKQVNDTGNQPQDDEITTAAANAKAQLEKIKGLL